MNHDVPFLHVGVKSTGANNVPNWLLGACGGYANGWTMAKRPNQSAQKKRAHPAHFVREWREFRGWSQEQLADLVTEQRHKRDGAKAKDVTRFKIRNIESGKTDLKMEFREELAGVFRVRPEDLTTVDPSGPEGARTARLLTAWHKLDEAKQDDIVKQVEAIVPIA